MSELHKKLEALSRDIYESPDLLSETIDKELSGFAAQVSEAADAVADNPIFQEPFPNPPRVEMLHAPRTVGEFYIFATAFAEYLRYGGTTFDPYVKGIEDLAAKAREEFMGKPEEAA